MPEQCLMYPAGTGKRYFETVQDITLWLLAELPGCNLRPEGSCGVWHWAYDDADGKHHIVGEAWMHRTKTGWWYHWNPAYRRPKRERD